MKLIKEVNNIFREADNYVKVKSYNFVTHDCEVKKEKIKIVLKYNISIEGSETKEIFGYCEHCNTVFYNKDFDSKYL